MKELKDRLNELQKKAEDYDRVEGELRKAKELLKVQGQAKIDLSTARPKWRLDGPTLSGYLLYSLVNHAYAIAITIT